MARVERRSVSFERALREINLPRVAQILNRYCDDDEVFVYMGDGTNESLMYNDLLLFTTLDPEKLDTDEFTEDDLNNVVAIRDEFKWILKDSPPTTGALQNVLIAFAMAVTANYKLENYMGFEDLEDDLEDEEEDNKWFELEPSDVSRDFDEPSEEGEKQEFLYNGTPKVTVNPFSAVAFQDFRKTEDSMEMAKEEARKGNLVSMMPGGRDDVIRIFYLVEDK